MTQQEIVVQGAREHNLKGIDLRVPRGAFTTITGVSGSGKSSLAFDTIFQEGQRRFLESLSSYARQFLGGIEKPKVDRVDGLSPTISIDQKTVNRNPRSTVGTVTEILDYLRLLFARLGVAHCPSCDRELRAQTKDQISDRIVSLGAGRKVQILAPIVRGRKGEYKKELEALRLKGFVRARIDGAVVRLDEPIALGRYIKHDIEVVVDRLVISEEKAPRVAEAVETASAMADGVVAVLVDDDELMTFSSRLACPDCSIDFPEMEPRLFSFNSPYGSCPECAGLGEERRFDRSRIVADETLSIRGGALKPMDKKGTLLYSRLGKDALEKVARKFEFSLDQPWNTLNRSQQDVLLLGSGQLKIKLKWEYKDPSSGRVVRGEDNKPVPGIIPSMEAFWKMGRPPFLERYMVTTTCATCEGTRLRKETRAVRFRERDLAALAAMTVEDLFTFFEQVELSDREVEIGVEILKEVRSRLSFLVDVGLGYLPLDRGARTLSGGEAQRVRLATQVGSELQGVLYVLDEPSIGLHQRDNHRLIKTLKTLRDRGNTVLVVEHDRDTMMACDYLVDVGPGAGVHGGSVVAAGTPREVYDHPASLTARYLREELRIEIPKSPRKGNGNALVVRGAAQHNLKGIDVSFPLGCFIAVTGVSGSGKSTLIDSILRRELARRLHGATDAAGQHAAIEGDEHIDKVVEIDQTPIGRTPRSNPATYSGAFTHIRDLFTMLPESKARGYEKGRFSFNVAGGRCEACVGAGVKVVEMQLLADVEVPCDACDGRRYNRETLEITYRGRTIHEVLEMTIEEAFAFFETHPKLSRILAMMVKVGLGYASLGQTATTLSGGEAQRLKLASELARPGTGNTLYLLDEPTTGLHFADIERLIAALQDLVERGNTVVVVEHNLDVVKVADHVIDLGPEGGRGGGELVFAGTVKQALRSKRSWTGRLLKEYLAPVTPPASTKSAHEASAPGRSLRVEGATLHNLKRVSMEVPHGSLTVVTGRSGSGKTSLAFDTVFAEAQRRFVESMSTYARRFLSRMDRAPTDRIEGLMPAIAIDRKAGVHNPRSTVATSTELYDYLRVLYARAGLARCPDCGEPMQRWTPTAAGAAAEGAFAGERILVLAPLYRKDLGGEDVLDRPKDFRDRVSDLRKRGFLRALVNGEEIRLDEPLPAAVSRAKTIDLVIDRLAVKAGVARRIAEAIEQAYDEARGLASVRSMDGVERLFTKSPACAAHGQRLAEEPQPRLFSFNSHLGACPSCDGLGRTERCDAEALVEDPSRPFLAGALVPPWDVDLAKPHFGVLSILEHLAAKMGFDLDAPLESLPAAAQDALLFGYDQAMTVEVVREVKDKKRSYTFDVQWEGVCGRFERKFRESGRWWRERLRSLMVEGPCPECDGERLNPVARSFTLGEATLGRLMTMTVDAASEFFHGLRLEGERAVIAKEVLGEIGNRLQVLRDVGLGYLALGRASGTLSGGEAQRIRLATQLGNRLVGVLYVLDEPTIGLHSRDTRRLIDTLRGLRDLGNTILVVEHDLDMIESADRVIDMGPLAGKHGGVIVAAGTPTQVAAVVDSPTGAWLRGDRRMERRAERRRSELAIHVRGAKKHNLKHIDVAVPLGVMTCVTGVSGSGKSTLVMDVLEPAIRRRLQERSGRNIAATAGAYRGEPFSELVLPAEIQAMSVVDQSALGPTPASNPATYTGIFDAIRDVFASTPEAKMRGYKKGRFSFNQKGGRCAACEGKGFQQVEMHFLSDVYMRCEACDGRRFDRETLAVRYGGRSIADVLDMEVDDAAAFFANHRRIHRPLRLLQDVGLGYLGLGQPATTLSGGEAQRVKLAAELGKARSGHTLYILDEPTTGLHLEDVSLLIDVLHRLVDVGNTVLVVEHHPELIASADHVIDLGPEGGEAGGELVAAGSPEVVARTATSETAVRLRMDLARTTGAKPRSRARKSARTESR